LYASLCVQAQIAYSLGDDAPYIARIEKEAETATSDSARAYMYLKLSSFCKLIKDTVKAKDYLNRGIRLGEKYPFLQAAAYYYKGHAQYGKMDLAVLEKNLLIADSLLRPFTHKEADRIRGMLWINRGIMQQIKGDEKGAMDIFTNKVARYAQQAGDGLVLGKAYKNIAIVFMNNDQRDRAASYLKQAVEQIENSPKNHPTRLEELTEAYIVAGENYVYLHQYEQAKTVLDKAKAVLTPHPQSNLYLIYYYAEGAYYDNLRQYPAALNSYSKGIDLASRLNAILPLNRLKYAKYETLYNQKDYKNAAFVMEDLLKSPYVFTTDKKIYYKALYTTYTHLGDTKEAFRWAERYITLSDSLYEKKYQNDIIELETKYKNAENEKKIAALQAEQEKTLLEAKSNRLLNWLLSSASVFLFASAVFSFLFYRNNKKLSVQKEVNLQQKLKETEQNQQIQLTKALLDGEEKERKRLATDLHDGLGGLLAGIKINVSRLATNVSPQTEKEELTQVIQQLDISANELRRISRNLMPESLLQLGLTAALRDLSDSFSTDTTHVDFQALAIEETISKEKQVNIYRIIQELLTNAVRHAQASEILVQCSQNKQTFFITVEDNGKGFETTEKGVPNGIGLSNVKSRVEYLKGKMDVASALHQGTTINIEFDV
jgi:signal transduction histidine kinase